MLLKSKAALRNAGSLWEASADSARPDPKLVGNAVFDVAVIGGGIAGLSTALPLAQAGVSVCVLESEHVGFGASGRNGGFCCLGGTRLSPMQMVRTFGKEEARKFLAFQIAGIGLVSQRLEDWEIDAARHSKGEVTLAHKPAQFKHLRKEAEFLKSNFGLESRLLSKDDLASGGLAGPDFHGGLHLPYGFALNPMTYVVELAKRVRAAGGKIYGKSLVTGLRPDGNRWRLETGEGMVRANKVVLAGNGYSRETVPKWLGGRTLRAMSTIRVTRPLSDEELSAQGWTSDLMASDTRTLLHYFRLMPDRRFLFGTRGGIFENTTSLNAVYARAKADFDRMFPAWAHVEADHQWHGRVCLARNRTPFVGGVPNMPGVYAAMGWHGSGVALSSISGEKLAGVITGRISADSLPAVIRRPFRKFPLPLFRKLYLQGAYWWYGLTDA